MNLKILILPGDGIGVEVTSAAVEVLKAVAKKFGHTLELSEGLIGGVAIHKTGTPLPQDTLDKALAADATQSATCAYLAAVTLAGLLIFAVWHIAWVDTVAALAAIPILVVEGRRAWRGEGCGCC